MKTLTTNRSALLVGLLFGLLTQSALAGTDSLTSKRTTAQFGIGIQVDDPTYCWALNSQDRCVLFLGSQSACDNTSPCTTVSADTAKIKQSVADSIFGDQDLTFCYGADDVTGQCKLYAGSAAACASLDPCSFQFERIEPQFKLRQ